METTSTHYLGVDGGGTKTLGVLTADDGRVIRTARVGAGNAAVLGADRFAARLRGLLSDLLRDESPACVRAATIGLAGVGRPEERERVRSICAELGLERVTVMTDGELHYVAALGDDPGVLLAVGTGSVCTVRDASGELSNVGGWGYLLGDEGSGYAIGRDAYRLALADHELGFPPSPLTRAMLEHYRVDAAPGLISLAHASESPQARVAETAAIVSRLSDACDAARRLVDDAAGALLALLERGLARLDTSPPHAVALRGGLLDEGSPVARALVRRAADTGLSVHYRDALRSPLGAAIALAKQHAGESLTPSFLERIDDIQA